MALPVESLIHTSVPSDINSLLFEAYVKCVKIDRYDIILTYVCNLKKRPRTIDRIKLDLQTIVDLSAIDVAYTFIPIC